MLLPGTSHWMSIARRAGRDGLTFALGFLLANYVRFHEFWRLEHYIAPISVGAVALMMSSYIMGLYSVESRGRSRFFAHGLLTTLAFTIAFLAVIVVGYVDFGTRVGRGFMFLGLCAAYPTVIFHHWLMFNKHRFAPERVAFVAETPNELEEYETLKELKPRGIEIVGRLTVKDNERADDVLGRLKHAPIIIQRHKIDRIVFADWRLTDPYARPFLRQLRYSGVTCVPFISLCEHYLQYVPLHLVTNEWLMHLESAPRDFYFSKLKRAFDILTSLGLLVALSPFLLAGILLVKFFSPEGPLFFTQERVGRFGKKFKIFKLRSMRTDAEKNGPQWSSGTKDPRVFPGGKLLRQYRIDEIPQLFNILRGDMSFVGPRPEQPAFVDALKQELSFYEERHMILPGLTGWAQVSYPYGSTTDDARCKLEYDLYYLKHAGVVFDLLILLDTVRVVLIGGMKKEAQRPRYLATPTSKTSSIPIMSPAVAQKDVAA
ncbi:exopolysaccharide biosynthesis polyprenyl glycosylphosphotransferase [Prosthecobacter debontii]|uniref:Exopolysaccharide biosynthesis polyprenyl glycosylphosphotransferase n=1 Tax=Prosthecobacter debontii TaxID=48467 RepID=A0A1T4WIK0_9BACT|nr:sugar transferase [Prosthecobacter debontii]SKA77027.1 exopolysaccharide biosynthesis polyprenyl glycosylphosphotransferase [Prosthecobacter debontii]